MDGLGFAPVSSTRPLHFVSLAQQGIFFQLIVELAIFIDCGTVECVCAWGTWNQGSKTSIFIETAAASPVAAMEDGLESLTTCDRSQRLISQQRAWA